MITREELIAAQGIARQTANVFRLPFQKRSWRGLAGAWQGKGSGASIDFKDHRPYLPGDDPRHINWSAYARTGHVSMKVYQEEVRPHLDIILDASPSMWQEEKKRRRCLELLYFCMENGWKSGSSLHWYVSGERIERRDPRELSAAGWRVPSWTSRPAQMPEWNTLRLTPGGLRVFISDLLFPGAPEKLLNPLSQGGGLVLLLAPFSKTEAEPDWQGNIEFVDCESGIRRRQRVVSELLSRYGESYRRHFAAWSRACLKSGCVMASVPSEKALSEALQNQALGRGAVELVS